VDEVTSPATLSVAWPRGRPPSSRDPTLGCRRTWPNCYGVDRLIA